MAEINGIAHIQLTVTNMENSIPYARLVRYLASAACMNSIAPGASIKPSLMS